MRRDLPQLVRAAQQVEVGLSMSIAVYDDELAAALSTGCAESKARLDTVRAASDLGLPVTVFLMPVLPYLTDTREHLERAAQMAREAGASRAIYTALHLRPGVREWFLGVARAGAPRARREVPHRVHGRGVCAEGLSRVAPAQGAAHPAGARTRVALSL